MWILNRDLILKLNHFEIGIYESDFKIEDYFGNEVDDNFKLLKLILNWDPVMNMDFRDRRVGMDIEIIFDINYFRIQTILKIYYYIYLNFLFSTIIHIYK